jgi:pyruvate, water dikinase
MEVTSGTNAFPKPSEITDVPGAENWRSMYPYYTRFQQSDDDRFWFYNATFLPSILLLCRQR